MDRERFDRERFDGEAYVRPKAEPDGEVRIEDELTTRLRPLPGRSARRLPAALPFAIAGILVVTSVAFGAAALRPSIGPVSTPSPLVGGNVDATRGPDATVADTLVPETEPSTRPDDLSSQPAEPSDAAAPTAATSEAPGATGRQPEVAALSLTASIAGGKVKLTWSRFDGEGFAFYKIVRSSDASVEWPAAGDDVLVGAISDRASLSFADAAPKRQTASYRVFAVASGDAGYGLLAASAVRTIAVPADATPKPTAAPTSASGPASLGTLAVAHNDGSSYTFSWPAYGGSSFTYYKLVYGAPGTQPYYPAFNYFFAGSSRSQTSWTGTIPAGDYVVRMQVIDYPDGDPVVIAQTNLVRLTVTASDPVPTAPADLGAIAAKQNTDGTYTLSWNAYSGPIDFSYYKLVGEPAGTNPDYTATGHYWQVLDTSRTSWTGKIAAGSWWIRVQAIYYPEGARAAAQTQVLKLTAGPAPTPSPKPAPVAIALSAVAGDGVQLTWGKYTGTGFEYYKVVRSETNASPSYPENAGTSLVAAIGDQSTVGWTDDSAEAGHTYYYRVVAYSFADGGTVLGISPVRSVAIPAAG